MFKAKTFNYKRTMTPRELGTFATMYDAKIACERHAKQPLRWTQHHEAGPFASAHADVRGLDGRIERVYIASPESEAAE